MPQQAANAAAKLADIWRLISPTEIAQCVWRSWLDDPNDKDEKGVPTAGRLHWYIPEALQDEVDAKMHERGGAEKMRDVYRGSHWRLTEKRLKSLGML